MSIRQPPRKPLPTVWLMTDPRLGEGLLAAICRLPKGSGVVFRHYHLPLPERRTLFAKVRRVCRQRGHMVLLAGDERMARKWKADGVHGRGRASGFGLQSVPVHNVREIAVAKRNGAQLLFLSPLRATHSHPGQRPLGPSRFHQLAKLCRPAAVIALGGMSRAEAMKWPRRLVRGWAGIDCFANARFVKIEKERADIDSG
ncbi:MAG: thiamine phosphate synthase [Sphingorhabdus sp.]